MLKIVSDFCSVKYIFAHFYKKIKTSLPYRHWFLQAGFYGTKKEKRIVVSGLKKPLLAG